MKPFLGLSLLLVLSLCRTALAAPQAVYDVRAFGAVGDGVTDDTVAIRAAADALQAAASAAGSGGKLLFPSGRYLIFSPGVPERNRLAVFRGLKGINVISEGAEIVIGHQFTSRPAESAAIFGFYDCINITVDGFTVSGPSLNIASGVPHGANLVALYQGNTNAFVNNNRVQGVMAALNCYIEQQSQPKSRNITVGTLYASDSVYGITTGNGCDDLVVHALTTAAVGRSYVAYGVKNHTVSITSSGSFAEDVALSAPLDNIRLTYNSPADYWFPGGLKRDRHARVRMNFNGASSAIRNVDIRLHVTYDAKTEGGPAFRLVKDAGSAGQTLENLRISGYVKGKGTQWPAGDPVIGTPDAPNHWSDADSIRNIELSNLRIENSAPVRFILPGLKGPFLIENVHSDNAIQLVQARTGGHPAVDPPHNGRYAVVNSTFPNLASYYPAEGAEPLEPINAAVPSLTIPLGWQGHTLSTEWIGGTVTYTLPAAVPGLEYGFLAVNGRIVVRPQGGETIRGGGAETGLFLDTAGDAARLRCVVAGTWEIVSSNGALARVPSE